MPSNSSRLRILQKIEDSEEKRTIVASDEKFEEIYKPILPDAVVCFKNELEAVHGQCVICDDESDLYKQLKSFVQENNFSYLYCRDGYIEEQLKSHNIPFSNSKIDFNNMQAGITGCEFLVARTGSVLVSSANDSGRQMNIFPPIHIVLSHISQLVDYPEDALRNIQSKYGDSLPSAISMITGPSRTADIEKTLVLGAHGPKRFIVFLSKI